MDTKKLLPKAKLLAESLDELESRLEPILSHPLGESLASLDKLQQAKLNVLLPYLINDLIFIYLKTQGLDPKTHPVVSELSRVRDYFAKLSSAEEGDKKPTLSLDKAAAGRFIRHAIAQAKQSTNDNEVGPSEPSIYVPARTTEKMKERETYLRSLKDDGEGEEQALEIIDEIYELKEEREEKGEAQEGKKRRRPMDPFTSTEDVDSGFGTVVRKSRKVAEIMVEDVEASSRASSVSNADDSSGNVEKKRKRKRNKKA